MRQMYLMSWDNEDEERDDFLDEYNDQLDDLTGQEQDACILSTSGKK